MQSGYLQISNFEKMKKSLTPFGETEMEILHIVWGLGEASVAEVQAEILKKRKVAYTTVMTIMKNLNDKGYLKYRKDGVTFIYSAAQKPESVQSSLIDSMVNKVFKGSASALVQTLVTSEKLTEKEIEEIRKLIDNMEE